jgi:hypothetical protein
MSPHRDRDAEVPAWRRLLLNRFVLVPGAIVAVAVGWNA